MTNVFQPCVEHYEIEILLETLIFAWPGWVVTHAEVWNVGENALPKLEMSAFVTLRH